MTNSVYHRLCCHPEEPRNPWGHVLPGAATNWCIRATAYAALESGYDLTLIKDAHTTGTIEMQDGGKIEASDIVKELNIVMKWVSYPGRENRTSSANDLDFAVAAADE